jgi:hypothetical protein
VQCRERIGLRIHPTHTRFSCPIIGYLPINLIYSSMPVQDRTNEFLACVDSIRNRSTLPARNTDKQQSRADGKSEFTRMASAIGKDIGGTTVKLGKLAQCVFSYPLSSRRATNDLASVAKRKTLFDDRPVEISVRGTCVAPLVTTLTSHANFRNSLSSLSKTLQILTSRLRRSRRM